MLGNYNFHHPWINWFEDFDCNFRRDKIDHQILPAEEQNPKLNESKEEKSIWKQEEFEIEIKVKIKIKIKRKKERGKK